MIMNKKNQDTKQYFICVDYDFRELPNTLGEHGKLFQNAPNFKKEAFRTRKKLLSESLKINEFINSGIRIAESVMDTANNLGFKIKINK